MLNPSWLGHIASGPEILASGSSKTSREWTHDSLCPERSVSGTAWTLAHKHCAEWELLCTTAFGPCYPPASLLPRQARQLPIKPLRRLSLQFTLLILCASISSLLTFSFSPLVLLVQFNTARFSQPRHMAVLGEINSPSCSAPCFWREPELKNLRTCKNEDTSNIFAF